jgi:hypothetical protein
MLLTQFKIFSRNLIDFVVVIVKGALWSEGRSFSEKAIGVQRGVSRGLEDGFKPPAGHRKISPFAFCIS